MEVLRKALIKMTAKSEPIIKLAGAQEEIAVMVKQVGRLNDDGHTVQLFDREHVSLLVT